MASKQMIIVEQLKKAFEGKESMSKIRIRREVDGLKVIELKALALHLGFKGLSKKRKPELKELIAGKIDFLPEVEEEKEIEEPWEPKPVDKRFKRKKGKEGDVIQVWEAEASDIEDLDQSLASWRPGVIDLA